MAVFAASTLEFSKATIWYLVVPRSDERYGRWPAAAHDVLADFERPMSAMRIGAMVGIER